MAKKTAGKKVVKAAGASKAKPVRGARLVVPPGKVVVRMYRQGLGDCFLLAFGPPKGQGNRSKSEETRYVLIDCGVHKRQDDGTTRLAQVMDDVMAATGNHLHVVVATHEHADHLSGFVQKGSPFLTKDIAIDQLWVAWTEKRGDKLADKLRQRHGTQRQVIEKAIKKLDDLKKQPGISQSREQTQQLGLLSDRLRTLAGFEDLPSDGLDHPSDDATAIKLIEGVIEHQEDRHGRGLKQILNPSPAIAPGLGATTASRAKPSSNELALGVLQARADHVTYCRPGDDVKIDDDLPIRVHVLGPPHDEDLLKKDLPTKIKGAGEEDEKYKEVYLSGFGPAVALDQSPALMMTDDSEAEASIQEENSRFPFDVRWRWPLQSSKWGGEYEKAGNEWRRIDGDWLGAAGQLALNLDSDTNNTSLVLAFEFNNRVLLFCGDAQVGNWLSWRDQKYLDQQGNKTVTVDDLFARTVLYKVGHHGSHNATLKRDPRSGSDPNGDPYGLELMRDIVAFIPVDRAAAEKKMPGPWEMPHLPLYKRLREKSQRRVLRADARSNIRPLPKNDENDVAPTSSTHQVVPNLVRARWRKSEAQFPKTKDPVYYEIELS